MAMASARRSTTTLYLACLALAACKKPAGTSTTGAAVTMAGPRAYVTDSGSDSISVIERDGAGVTTVPVDVDPHAHEAPHHLAIDPESGVAFVALSFPPAPGKGPHGSHGSGAVKGRLARVALDRVAVTSAVDVDENPGDVILTHDKRRVLVTHFDMKRAMDVAARGGASPADMFAKLLVIDARTFDLVAARSLCTAPHGIATTRDGRTAFVACYGSDELAVVDLRDRDLATSRVPLGAAPGVPGVPRYGPYSATLSPDERSVVVATLEGHDVRVFDRASRAFVRTVSLDAKAFMPAFVDDATLVVPTQAPDGLARVDLAGAIQARVTLPKSDCTLPHVVRVASDGRIYLVCEGDHVGPGTVLEIDRDLHVKKRWRVGVAPDGIDFY